jgi:hypothetical protein
MVYSDFAIRPANATGQSVLMMAIPTLLEKIRDNRQRQQWCGTRYIPHLYHCFFPPSYLHSIYPIVGTRGFFLAPSRPFQRSLFFHHGTQMLLKADVKLNENVVMIKILKEVKHNKPSSKTWKTIQVCLHYL